MKTLLETRPNLNIKIDQFKGNGGFNYITVPWIIAFEDEGKTVMHDGREYTSITGDMMMGSTTFILTSELQAWREWARD